MTNDDSETAINCQTDQTITQASSRTAVLINLVFQKFRPCDHHCSGG